MEEKQIGILLQMTPYLGKSRILKIFTKDAGLITLMAGKRALAALTSPFCIAEWIYKKGQREIASLLDGSLIDNLISLRQSYELLAAAGRMAQDLLRSQPPANLAPALYELLSYYLKKLEQAQHPMVLADSFRLKLLLHDGLLSLSLQCSCCTEKASAFTQGKSVCIPHANPATLTFTQEQWQTLYILAGAKSFGMLQAIPFKEDLQTKIDTLFEERMRNLSE
ncbi:MAG: DNA repair protein RecO [Chlamydiia bacterium]|nr:DNA repair protein RecO [Chlamydiia bacterium]